MAQQRPIAIELDGETEPSDPLARAELELERRLEADRRVLPEEIAEARERQAAAGGRLATALWELGLVDEVRLRTLGAEIFRVPPALPGDVAGAPEEVVSLLDADFVRTYRVAPFARNREVLLVATAEPWRLPLLDSIGSRLGCRVQPRFLDEAPLARLLGTLYGLPVDERFQREPAKRRAVVPAATESEDDGPGGSSDFGSASQLMSETTFEQIYQSGDTPPPAADGALGGADSFEEPSPAGATPALQGAEVPSAPPSPAAAARPAVRSAGPPPAALALLDAIEGWDPRYDTRRASPLGLEESRAALAAAADVHQLGWVLARHALTLGRRVLLFFHRADTWLGWTGAGDGVAPGFASALMVPAHGGTLFGEAATSKKPWTGPLHPHPLTDHFLRALGGGEPPRRAALVPVAVAERIALGIYLDGGPGGALPESLWSIAALASDVPAALERLAHRERG